MNREEYYASLQQYRENSLEHHGILGMKWSIRRYQNYDGTYTQAGLKRYKETVNEYVSAKNRYKKAKKSGNAEEKANAKVDLMKAKNKEKADYKQLKADKRADEGMKEFLKGERIGKHEQTNERIGKAAKIATVAAGVNSLIAYNKYRNMQQIGAFSDSVLKNSLARTYALSFSVPLAIKLVQEGHRIYSNHKNDKLRDYYMHDKLYNVRKKKGLLNDTYAKEKVSDVASNLNPLKKMR